MLELKRAIRRFVSKLTGTKKIVFFIAIAMICVVAISIGIYTQYFYKYSETDPLMIGINIGSEKTAEELQLLEANFNSLFQNTLKVNSENVNIVDKLEESKDLVYTGYKLENEDENYYSVNAKIPLINISSENHNYAKYKHSGGKFNISAGKHDFDSPVYAPAFIKK